jgi:predicted regulator of Ras-like GTPase activity (Roadblock/LC7/MglB family)
MSGDKYANALRVTLTEVRNICPDITYSFIFTKEGKIIAEAEQDTEVSTEITLHSFQNLIEKADTIGGINTFVVNGNKGMFQISRVNNMYLAISASKKADMTCIQSAARVIVPTIMKLLENKLLENIVSTPTTSAASYQNLTTENLTGLFAGETAQVDNAVLKEWSKNLNSTHIDEIEIETPNGKTARCKVKPISEREFQGKGLIRIPEKIYRLLEVEKGEQVKVKPAAPWREII